MNSNPKNYQDGIHNDRYEDRYATPMADASGMICDAGRQSESLNGMWRFQIDQYDSCLRNRWYEEKRRDDTGRFLPLDYDFESWAWIKVPSCWNTQNERYYYYEGPAVYTRTFRYQNRGEGRTFIKFGAVNYEAKVFLNREYLGCHKGGSTPFFFETTGKLLEENRLLVVADNTRKLQSVPARNTDWFNYGGIYRDVEFFRLPETFIRDFTVSLVPGSGFGKIAVRLKVDGSRQDGLACLTIGELGLCADIPVSGGVGYAEIEAQPELWNPDNPKLYQAGLSYLDDRVCEQIGLREIRAVGTELFLNGKRIFLKGVCAHEESVPNGKEVTEEEIAGTFAVAKEMNCNYMRLAHYPHTEKAARIADRMGVLLWEEIPVYWAIAFGNRQTYQDAENQLTELIRRDRNRASVILWSVGNENADTDERLWFMSGLAKKAKQLDSTRLVTAACLADHENLVIRDRLAEVLDVIGLNEYYGWYSPDLNKLIGLLGNSSPAKPVVIAEFGADACPGARGTVDDLGTEDCQRHVYELQVSALRDIPYVRGISPWILYDFRCPRRSSGLQREYNTKGLLSADKKHRKLAFNVMQKFYSEDL